MDKLYTRTKRNFGTTNYCYTCFAILNDKTGRVLVRPLKPLGYRTSIPLEQQRMTMCTTHAQEAITAGTFAEVKETGAK